MRFTLPKLFLAVGMAALACAGMVSPTHWWANSILSLTAGLFVATICRAVGLQGRKRVIAIAFSVVGGGYLLLVSCSEFHVVGKALVTNYPMALVARTRFADLVSYSTAVASTPAYSPQPLPNSTPVYQSAGIVTTTLPNGAQTSTAYGVPSPPVRTVRQEMMPLDGIIMLAASQDDDAMPLARFFLIGHCVWSWLIGLAGALYCGYAYSQRKPLQTS